MAMTLAAESSNSIRWISSTTALLIGTGGEEWALRLGGERRADRAHEHSRAAAVGLFIHAAGGEDRERGDSLRAAGRAADAATVFTEAQQSFTAGDLTVLAPHMTEGGVRQMAFQQAPRRSCGW